MIFLIFLPRDWALCGQCCKFQPCKLKVFSSPGPLGVRRLSSVNFSHFKLLLRNHLADWNRT